QVFAYLEPTFGRTMVSRINSTTASMTFANPKGADGPCFKYFRTVQVMTTNRKAPTSHSIRTCLVTDRSIPNTVGNGMMGCSSGLLETWSRITFPGSNPPDSVSWLGANITSV